MNSTILGDCAKKYLHPQSKSTYSEKFTYTEPIACKF